MLAPVMKRAGFKSLKSGYLGWVREGASGTLTCWFQSDKWGWNDRWGSRFTVEFRMTPLPGDATGQRPRDQRIGYLLEGFDELDELRVLNDMIIACLPGTIRREWVTRVLPDGTEVLVEGYKPKSERAVYGDDVWLNFYSVEDVRAWAAYFADKLPHFISLFENEIRSAAGQASDRFHRMMGVVQRTADRAGKAAVLRQYLEAENDQHYRMGARYYLDLIEQKLNEEAL